MLSTRLTRRGVLGGAAVLGVGAPAAFGIASSILGSPTGLATVSAAPLAQADEWQVDLWTAGLAGGVDKLAQDRRLSTLPSSESYIVFYHLYDTLVAEVGLRYGPGFTQVPRLAESWELIDDLTWQFTLRQGVAWHNGDPFTAEDVKYSIDDALDPEAQDYGWQGRIESVEILDPYTIQIVTKGPQAAFISSLSGFVIFPKTYREAVGFDEFALKPVGTGPYKLAEFAPDEQVVLEVNSAYWDSPVNGPARLVIRAVPDPPTRVAELQTGGVNIIAAPPQGQLEQIASGAETELIPLKGSTVVMYLFNMTKPPFDDLRVRQAVNLAINKEAIINDLLSGFGEPLHGPFSSSWLGYDPNLEPYPFDLERAKQLLAEAGYADGFTLDFNFSTSGLILRGQEIAEVVEAQLAEIGVTAILKPTEENAIVQGISEGTLEGISQTTWGTSADPQLMLDIMFLYTAVTPPDETLSGLIEEARVTLDPEQRKGVLEEIGRYVNEQAPWLFIHAQDDFWAKGKGVAWEPYPIAGTFSWPLFYRPN